VLTPRLVPWFWLCLPFALPQALWLRRTARRLPPATGDSFGRVGVGEPRRLLSLGDSIVAGVGVDLLQDALPGQLANALARSGGWQIDWTAIGINGADASQLVRDALPALGTNQFDFIFVSVGVNDVTRLTLLKQWSTAIDSLLSALCRHSPNARIILAAVPPMRQFPALPWSLRKLLGHRAEQLDDIGRERAARFPQVIHFSTPLPGTDAFAEDGYHPGVDACRVWACATADQLRKAASSAD